MFGCLSMNHNVLRGLWRAVLTQYGSAGETHGSTFARRFMAPMRVQIGGRSSPRAESRRRAVTRAAARCFGARCPRCSPGAPKIAWWKACVVRAHQGISLTEADSGLA